MINEMDSVSKAVVEMMGAKEISINRSVTYDYELTARWTIPGVDIYRTASSVQKTADLLIEFWNQATKVISLPRVKELEAELRGRDKEIVRLKDELSKIEKYKIAWEMSK